MRQLSPDAPGLDPLHAKAAALIRTVDRTTKRLYRKPTRDVELVRTIRDAVHSLGVVERRIEVAASGIGTGRQRWLPTSIACGRSLPVPRCPGPGRSLRTMIW